MVDTPQDPTHHNRPSTPRWVKALGAGLAIAVLMVVIVMLTSGGQHGPGLHAGSPAGGGPSAPVSAPVAAGGVGGPVDAGAATRTVEVSALDSLAFDPRSLEVSAGEAVTFVVTNRGKAVHEFTLGDAAMQRDHAESMAHIPDGMVHEVPNSLTLQPGETKELTWRFAQGGTLEYACHEPGHYDGGMRGHLTVS